MLTLTPTAFTVSGLPVAPRHPTEIVTVERVCAEPAAWVARMGGAYVLTTEGAWEWEPQPSHRDAAFLDRTRYVSTDAALVALEQWVVNGAVSPWV